MMLCKFCSLPVDSHAYDKNLHMKCLYVPTSFEAHTCELCGRITEFSAVFPHKPIMMQPRASHWCTARRQWVT
jgi:hypothetical protein